MMSSLAIERGPESILLLDETIGQRLRRSMDRFPDNGAVVVLSQNTRVTYSQLWHETTRAANALLAHDISPGDRIGIWSANRYEWLVIQYAAARMGAILVNVNPSYEKDELGYVLRQSGMELLIHAARHKRSDYVTMVNAVRSLCPDLRHCIDLDSGWRSFLDTSTQIDPDRLPSLEKTLNPLDPINIQYTSGTTGSPKGATLTHRNILNNGYLAGCALGYTTRDRVCVPVPFYHTFGCVLGSLACMSHGACIVVPGDIFQPLAVLEAIQAERCTSLYGVPTMFLAILEHSEFGRFDVSSLRTGIMAGSPCPIELMKRVVTELHMPEVAIGYGMTETSPLSTFSSRADPLERRVSTVGRVMPHTEVSIRDLDDQPVTRGVSGEFCTRGYHVMQGYWNDEAATRRAIDAGGWMHSGDLAMIDDEGYVHITGRLKDLIIRGGENVYPREVEAVLEEHPAVSAAQVIGVPSHRYGEEVMAWVRLKPGATASEDELLAYCRGRIAAYKTPRYWRFVDDFPMTVTGKIQKYKLREMAIDLFDLHAAAAEKTA